MKLNDFLNAEEQFPIEKHMFSCDDILMWPFVRHALIDHFLGRTQVKNKNCNKTKTKKIPFFKQFFSYNPFFYKNKKYVFISDEIYAISKTENNNDFFNRMIDYYLNDISKEDFLVLERIRDGHKLQRTYSNIAVFNNISDIANKVSKLKSVKKEDKQNIDIFISELKHYFEFDENLEKKIRKNLLRLSKELFIYKTLFSIFFKRTKPKVLFFTRGFIEKSYIVKWAKEFGIKTVEIQHCIIGKEKAPYLFSETVSSKLKNYFVDTILTYGDYWNNNIKMDVEKISIGNPYFEEQILKFNAEIAKVEKSRVLIISQPELRDEMINLATALKKRDKNLEVLFRYHPVKELSKQHKKELDINNIEIDSEKNVYKSLSKCENIVGCFSTVLYEASGFEGKKIFILDNDFSRREVGSEFGIWFTSVQDLEEKIRINLIKTCSNGEKYFKKNTKENMINYINKLENKEKKA